jgi:HAD superfamily hydrolase (TIGR01490 family)
MSSGRNPGKRGDLMHTNGSSAASTSNPQMNANKRAVFYDVDGTLLKSNIVSIYLYYALRHASLSRRATEFARLLAMTPAYKVMDLFSRTWFNKVFYKSYKGIGQDRLIQLGKELARDILIPNVYPEARRRIEAAARQGLEQVLVTGSLEYVIRPFAEELGIRHIITNRLEINEDNIATGRLIEPILAGKGKDSVIREFARSRSIDLDHSYAFADSIADLEMLECVGYPVAVNASRRLQETAERRGWPTFTFG